jgi:hypothetical protein
LRYCKRDTPRCTRPRALDRRERAIPFVARHPRVAEAALLPNRMVKKNQPVAGDHHGSKPLVVVPKQGRKQNEPCDSASSSEQTPIQHTSARMLPKANTNNPDAPDDVPVEPI